MAVTIDQFESIQRWICSVEMVTISIVLGFMIYKQHKIKAANFYKTLCQILLVADLSAIVYSNLFIVEQKNMEKRDPFYASLIGTAIGLNSLCLSVAHWMFGFKYYVTASELPNLIKGVPYSFQRENRYQ
jgi:uncharacterized protein YybS (DUF2232 family)